MRIAKDYEVFASSEQVAFAETGLKDVVHKFRVNQFHEAVVVKDPDDGELVGVLTTLFAGGFGLVKTFWELSSAQQLEEILVSA